jgi:hypothetical protein
MAKLLSECGGADFVAGRHGVKAPGGFLLPASPLLAKADEKSREFAPFLLRELGSTLFKVEEGGGGHAK